ncbi:hypothetical protein SAMN05443572_101503 [Myxococcus fulvus]|uniref:Lipoprotein n=1 Tax=Myxococcus fulvus TaxID=33 RepID=A0A511SZZ1_MYXFU|nr:hypothetical protein [Myxococcus fulvus]GEN07479.1 hypothetical protein MFU01_25160 [Myxococcus fulvus]SES89497.1 hypothetical protein SAMN05443572_101503 [Myxococcus fulvus]
MKQLWVVICLVTAGFASPAWAQLSGRCGGDDNLTPQQVAGRNAWARKCNYISAAKEAILNADNEYQVFANGCFQYPCSTNNCQYFVPVSASAPCVSGLINLGSCVAHRESLAPREGLLAYLETLEAPWPPAWFRFAAARDASRDAAGPT